jgi:thiamine kinase-like enzyme
VAVPAHESPALDMPAAELTRLLDAVECLRGRSRHVVLLPGGLTNTNLRVTTDDVDVVVRISDPSTSLLGIDRDAERANSEAAATAGAGPRVVDAVPAEHLLVVEYIESRTLAEADLAAEDMLVRVAGICAVLHGGPAFANDFDIFAIQRRYLDTVRSHGFALPDRYTDFEAQVDQIGSALDAQPVRRLPCHNDLLAANLVDDGERLWIIDYEYSGTNDPYFELGNIWSEASLDLDLLDVLVTAYSGQHRPDLVARARLLGLMSKYGWTLWASIQHATSPLDFDFWEWGMEKYDRAVAEFDGPDFERLLDAAGKRA